jgi:orotate phosphoribosyltransferase
VHFCKALRDVGAEVNHAFVIFYYGVFPQSAETLGGIGVNLHALATWWDVLELAEEGRYFGVEELREVRKFLERPAEWSAAHGGYAGEGQAKATA